MLASFDLLQVACFPEQITQFDFLGRIDSLRLEFSEKVCVICLFCKTICDYPSENQPSLHSNFANLGIHNLLGQTETAQIYKICRANIT